MSTEQNLATITTALTAALEAGGYFASRLHAVKTVKTKSSMSDLVTEVDPACEAMIRQTILVAHPSHQILGEESVAPGWEASAAAVHAVAEAQHLWIVDPLDGTTNFVYGMPLSTVSIGYAERGVLVAGVVYDPYRDEVFYGVRGEGAYRATTETIRNWLTNPVRPYPGDRLSVSNVRSLEEAVVASGFPTRTAMREKTTEAGIRLTNRVKNLRALGSAALHLAYVAAGRLDAFWEYDLNSWDLAAGLLLISEAGGHLMEISGADYTLRTRDIVTGATQELTERMRQEIG